VVAPRGADPQRRDAGETGEVTVSGLMSILQERREALKQRWTELVFASYPQQSVSFLRQERDRFANPLGSTIRSEIATLVEGLLTGADDAALTAPLDAIIRVRAVQDFSPVEALRFVFQLKQAVAEIVGDDAKRVPADELLAFHARLDELALQACGIYVGCRERVFQIRAREATARTYSLLKQAGLLVDADEAGGAPVCPPGEGRS
jgi:hypothetical protein